MRQPVLAEGAAPHLPAAGAARETRVEGARRLSPSRHVARPSGVRGPAEQPLRGLAQQPLAAAVHQPEPPVAVEGEHRDVDLLDHPAEQRRRLELAEPLRRSVSLSAFTSSSARPSASSGLAPRARIE